MSRSRQAGARAWHHLLNDARQHAERNHVSVEAERIQDITRFIAASKREHLVDGQIDRLQAVEEALTVAAQPVNLS